MVTKGRIYEQSNEKSFEDDLDDFDDNTVLDKEKDDDRPDEVSLKVKKTRRPQTDKQKAAFARCRKIRAEKVAERKELQKTLKEQPPRKCKKSAPKKVAFEEESSDEEIIYKKPKPKKKPRVVYQEPSSEDSSDEEIVAVVKRRKKPKQKPKKPKKQPPKVIYQDELESSEEENESPKHEIDLPYQPQLYIV